MPVKQLIEVLVEFNKWQSMPSTVTLILVLLRPTPEIVSTYPPVVKPEPALTPSIRAWVRTV